MTGLKTLTVLFVWGGAAYICLELLWRGYTHISMFAAGGVCAALLYGVGLSGLPPPLCALWGAVLITAVEFIFGCVCNLALKLSVWDYSDRRCNYKGQICLDYFVLWLLGAWPFIIVVMYIAASCVR